MIAEVDKLREKWISTALPNLAASLALAIEVDDTFGHGPSCVTDPTEAVS